MDVLGSRVPFVPGERRMQFSLEEDSTRITATPVDWLGISFMPETPVPSFSMFWMISGLQYAGFGNQVYPSSITIKGLCA